ncbi:(2Fe-2S)-binding protein [Streptomyces sp. NBC_01387]|uniref:(2Fe-2S)-binding protein n=1 Tax=unclassified Streptomyces TaxID=2593676 RepID=UPI002DDAF444|nr:(2Fe-2S)-binding protein [Streptomyces sp. NBC_01766]WSC22911.1 (2Fe-2S)-binding protein [Streptomyces sp. NBC_01766]
MNEASDLLAQLEAVGPYFTVEHGERPDSEGFLPVSALYAGEGVLDSYVSVYARRMRTDQPRVAASTFQLGFASRLWSIALGSVVLSGRVPDLSPDRLRLRLTEDGPVELWLPEPALAALGPRPSPADDTGSADLPEEERRSVDAVHAAVAATHLRPLHDTLRARYGLSPQVLCGNAASALVGALRVLNGRRPDTEARATALVAALLEREPLAGSGEFIVEEGLGFAYLRNSCCLYYRVPGGGLCGDCVLRRSRRRRAV